LLTVKNFAFLLTVSLAFIAFGLFDDRGISLRARYKISGHLLMSGVFIYFTGIHFNFFHNDLINILLSIGFITFMSFSNLLLVFQENFKKLYLMHIVP
jgi:hypothetical protein